MALLLVCIKPVMAVFCLFYRFDVKAVEVAARYWPTVIFTCFPLEGCNLILALCRSLRATSTQIGKGPNLPCLNPGCIHKVYIFTEALRHWNSICRMKCCIMWNDLQKSLKLVDLVPIGKFSWMLENHFTEDCVLLFMHCVIVVLCNCCLLMCFLLFDRSSFEIRISC